MGLGIDRGGLFVGGHRLANPSRLLQHICPISEGVGGSPVEVDRLFPRNRRLGDSSLQVERVAEGIVPRRRSRFAGQRREDDPFGFESLAELDAHPCEIPEKGGWCGIPCRGNRLAD